MKPRQEGTITFKATEAGCIEEEGLITCGASNANSGEDYHYITLQQWAEDAEVDDQGPTDVYFEIDDQINSGYDLVKQCRLTRTELRLAVSGGFDWYPDLREVVVDLTDISEQDWEALRSGLQRAFRETPARLDVQ